MLPLEKQVVSLQLAKRLKELGVKQDSLFWWLHGGNGFFPTSPDYIKIWYLGDQTSLHNNYDALGRREPPVFDDKISAFTVAELGVMLPNKIKVEGEEFTLLIEKWHDKQRWHVNYEVYDDKLLTEHFWHKTEAEARAWMIIYLIENKLQIISEEK